MLQLPHSTRFQAFNLITHLDSAPRPWEAMPLHPAKERSLRENYLPWCHAINSQQKQRSTASLVLPLSSTHAGRRWGYCYCHWPNKPCSKCEASFDFPILPHHHFQRSLIRLHPEHSDALCAALWCHWGVSDVGMHLASLIQWPSFKRGAFPASFLNSKDFPNTPSPPCHIWCLY